MLLPIIWGIYDTLPGVDYLSYEDFEKKNYCTNVAAFERPQSTS